MREVAVSKTRLEGELREVMRSVDADDLELQMDALRQFKLAAMLKIAAMELTGQVSIMQASDGLTALAEVTLSDHWIWPGATWRSVHGTPCDAEGRPMPERLGIVGFGKAGGLELGLWERPGPGVFSARLTSKAVRMAVILSITMCFICGWGKESSIS